MPFRLNNFEFFIQTDDDALIHCTVRAAILIASKCQVFQTDDG